MHLCGEYHVLGQPVIRITHIPRQAVIKGCLHAITHLPTLQHQAEFARLASRMVSGSCVLHI